MTDIRIHRYWCDLCDGPVYNEEQYELVKWPYNAHHLHCLIYESTIEFEKLREKIAKKVDAAVRR